MDTTKESLKIALIAALVVVTSILHYSNIHGNMELHILHRELFFIPILLASFWFGLKFGVATAVAVSIIYAPFIFVHDSPHTSVIAVMTQILVFILVAFGLGWLVERERRQQKQMMEAESMTVLGRAAMP